jgi:hypothetical protein
MRRTLVALFQPGNFDYFRMVGESLQEMTPPMSPSIKTIIVVNSAARVETKNHNTMDRCFGPDFERGNLDRAALVFPLLRAVLFLPAFNHIAAS